MAGTGPKVWCGQDTRVQFASESHYTTFQAYDCYILRAHGTKSRNVMLKETEPIKDLITYMGECVKLLPLQSLIWRGHLARWEGRNHLPFCGLPANEGLSFWLGPDECVYTGGGAHATEASFVAPLPSKELHKI